MNGAILLVAVLVCPVVMGTMMLLMWRGKRNDHGRDVGGERKLPPGSS
jgi:hypothetical protein